MKSVNFKCIRCGYDLIIPEKTERVLCGKCLKLNNPQSFFGGVKPPGSENSDGSILQKIPGSIYKEIPDNMPGDMTADQGETGESAPKSGLLSVITMLFVIAPIISIIVSKLKLPPATTFIVLVVIVVIYQAVKKRS